MSLPPRDCTWSGTSPHIHTHIMTYIHTTQYNTHTHIKTHIHTTQYNTKTYTHTQRNTNRKYHMNSHNTFYEPENSESLTSNSDQFFNVLLKDEPPRPFYASNTTIGPFIVALTAKVEVMYGESLAALSSSSGKVLRTPQNHVYPRSLASWETQFSLYHV